MLVPYRVFRPTTEREGLRLPVPSIGLRWTWLSSPNDILAIRPPFSLSPRSLKGGRARNRTDGLKRCRGTGWFIILHPTPHLYRARHAGRIPSGHRAARYPGTNMCKIICNVCKIICSTGHLLAYDGPEDATARRWALCSALPVRPHRRAPGKI